LIGLNTMSSARAPHVLIPGGATPSVRREIDASVSKTVSNDTNLGRVGGHSSHRSFMFRCSTLLLLEITAGAGVSPVVRTQLRVR
jgi:hypothetical protein